MSEEIKEAGVLVSRLPHPATVTYNGMTVIVPPRSNVKNGPRVDDKSKLSKLPTGVMFVRKAK